MNNNKITVAHGDGIGPEIMDAVLKILDAANCNLEYEQVVIGKIAYEQGFNEGISQDAWQAIRNNKVILKAPLTTPQGKGFSSVNVSLRKNLGLYANIRPVTSLAPYIKSLHPAMDLVIIRENEEDLYSGIEYRPSPNTRLSLKLVSEQGSEKIIRYAFEYARQNNRKKVTCVTKDNIMKISDGMFHSIFDKIAAEYPEIENDHYIVDIGSARIASRPTDFDVLVTLNLYGDIISDIAAEVSGSVGVAGSANIGYNSAMFEAVHGSAPDIAGQNIANPSGLLQAAILMLEYLNLSDKAALVKTAWLKTIQDGTHTADIYDSEHSKQKVSTDEFAEAVISNLNKAATGNEARSNITKVSPFNLAKSAQEATLTGVDVYLQHPVENLDKLVADMQNACNGLTLDLENIAFKGMKIWPNKEIDDACRDLPAIRFTNNGSGELTQSIIIKLLEMINNSGYNIAITCSLFSYDNVDGFRVSA